MILLLLVWSGYQHAFASNRTATIAAVAQFALATFLMFAIVQLLTVLVLVPPLFAGTIADERQRKTLHYLMASRLSGLEIVADKTLGRLPHLAVFLAMGLPVMSLMSLFGGIPAEFVAVAYVGTVSSCAFAVALAVLVSTLARRVRYAVLLSYVLIFLWLLLPSFVAVFGSRMYGLRYQWIQPVNEWFESLSPFALSIKTLIRARPQVQFSAAARRFFLDGRPPVRRCRDLARLRRLATPSRISPPRGGSRTTRRGSAVQTRGGAARFLTRPECGDDAVLWKERYSRRPTSSRGWRSCRQSS